MSEIRFYPTHADAADVPAAMTENELSQAKVVILEQALSNTRLTVQDLEQQLAQKTAALQISRDVIRWLRVGTCPHITGKTYQNDAWFCDACAEKLQQCLLGDTAQETYRHSFHTRFRKDGSRSCRSCSVIRGKQKR